MTVSDLINKSLTAIGVLAAGETPATEERDDAFVVLNNLIASWSSQGLPVYGISRGTATLTGAGSYTIGTGQAINIARPVKLESASVLTVAGIRNPVRIIPVEEWTGVKDSTATGLLAEVLYYDGGFPTGNVYLAPKPSAGTLELFYLAPLAAFSSVSDVISLPPGYERALRLALAVELAPEYGRPVTPELQALSEDAKTSIFGLNRAVVGAPNMVEPPVATGVAQ